MSAAARSSTLVPDAELESVARSLSLFLSHGKPGVELVAADGMRLCLPEPLVRLLADAARELEEGRSVSLVSSDKELTTQQAADLLNMSRPFLVRLLEAGVLPYRRVGTHRRIGLADVLRYSDERSRQRKQALGEIADEAESLGLYQD